VETTFDYPRQFGSLLAERILETYPPLQSTKDPVAPSLGMLLRQALPAQALAITGTAKYLRRAKAARIVAECGAGKSQIVSQVASDLDYDFLDVRAVQLDPVDLRGLPRISEGQTE